MLTGKEQAILDALEPRAAQEGVEVVTVEIAGARKAPTIRVFIDTPDGVSFDELAAAQSWIDDIVEEIDPFPGAYMLEVSSPGIDRPLRTPEHFAAHVGQKAQVRTVGKLDGRATFSGAIVEADAEHVVLECDDGCVSIPFDQIKRANIKGVIEFG